MRREQGRTDAAGAATTVETGSVSPISTGLKRPRFLRMDFIVGPEKTQQVAQTRQFSHPAFQFIFQQ